MKAPVYCFISSPARWPVLPFEPEPKLSRPGFFLAKSINSLALLSDESGGTMITFGVLATSVIG